MTAIAIAAIQTMEGLAMLRVEGLIDWKLQAAVIDRVLRLPTSLFREYTVGDFVDRSMGIDAARQVFTGRALRSMMAGVFCWFSIGLMLYYDLKLGLIALGLTLVRALLIVATSAHSPLSREQVFCPAGQDRRLRAATDLRHRKAARRGRDRARARRVVEAIRRAEAQFHLIAEGFQCPWRFRGGVSADRHAHHLRRGEHT